MCPLTFFIFTRIKLFISVTRYTVHLKVLDSNDEFPVFVNEPRPFLSTMRSNAPLRTTVYTLSASDPDPGSSLRFYNNGKPYLVPSLTVYAKKKY